MARSCQRKTFPLVNFRRPVVRRRVSFLCFFMFFFMFFFIFGFEAYTCPALSSGCPACAVLVPRMGNKMPILAYSIDDSYGILPNMQLFATYLDELRMDPLVPNASMLVSHHP